MGRRCVVVLVWILQSLLTVTRLAANPCEQGETEVDVVIEDCIIEYWNGNVFACDSTLLSV